MITTRAAFALLSFAAMVGVSVWVASSNWPSTGLPLLSWQAHAAALTVSALELVARALKIQLSGSAVGLTLRFSTALRVCLGGDFAAAITPARSGAEPARFFLLSGSGMDAAGRVLVLFLELFLEMVSLTLVCFALALVFRGRGVSIGGLLGLVGGYSTAVVSAGAIGLVLARRNASGPPPPWATRLRMNAGHWRAAQRGLRTLRSSVASIRHSRVPRMLSALLASVVHVCCKVAVLPLLVFLADRSFALNTTSLAPLVLWPLALFYGGVVVPAPGGGGVIEGAFAITLRHAIPAGIFAASLLWWRVYTFYVYVLGGGFAAGDAALRAIRARTANASVAYHQRIVPMSESKKSKQ